MCIFEREKNDAKGKRGSQKERLNAREEGKDNQRQKENETRSK